MNKFTDIVFIIWSLLSIVVFIGFFFFAGWGGLLYSFIFSIFMVMNLITAGVVMIPNSILDLIKKKGGDAE